MKLKIAILGTRGIPNHYGGFEQLAEHLSIGLVNKGHEVVVYNSHNHPFKEKEFNGVEIIRCYDPENSIGTTGQFIYDLNCITNARKINFDILLFLGYTSSSIWGIFYSKRSIVISNMDGMEWKRSKYSKAVRSFLRYAEKLAVRNSDYLVADSIAIQSYLEKEYSVSSKYIAYGADIYSTTNDSILEQYFLTKQNYYLLIARMEPENNIEMILDGFHQSDTNKKFIVIGSTHNSFGKYIRNKFKSDERITFLEGIYDPLITHTLKSFCSIYFHGHSVGGTNPSLLEAMASKSLIAAHGNEFNKAVLNGDGLYFRSANDVREIIEMDEIRNKPEMIENNFNKIKDQYNWPYIIDQYEHYITECFTQSKK